MSEGAKGQEEMSDNPFIPPAIEEVIQSFDQMDAPFTVRDVHQALAKARRELQKPTEAENFGVWAEILAFVLVGNRTDASPWRTYFSPLASGTDEDGKPFYSPDIADANADVIRHWADRATGTKHPVLRARYADLVWEMTPVITGGRRDPEMARCAIDAYLSSATSSILPNLHERFEAALRALDLACLIHDQERTASARDLLLRLHREAVEAKKGLWWLAYDRLIQDKNAGVTDGDRQELVNSMEGLVLHFGDTSDPAKFNPHALEDAAKRLVQHYTRLGQYDDVRRLHTAIARSFEHFAGLGDAMIASSVLQTAVNAYRDAGLSEDSKRVRVLMQEKIREARTQMAPIVTEVKIPREDLDKFCAAIVDDDLGFTFVRLAVQFLPNKRVLEEQVSKTMEDAPLMAHMPQAIMADDHIAAKVGSVEDDPHGRLLQQTTMDLGLSNIWLEEALNKLFAKHAVAPEHFAGWANRLGIFEDMTFLLEGVRAWFAGDLVKAVHVLVPQAEGGLRGIVGQLGKPVTKAHPAVAGAGVALTMGDILYSKELTAALGPDLTLYLLALYADPRGINLRNDVAHGLIKPGQITEHLVRLLIHTLLVFGVWKELAEKRR